MPFNCFNIFIKIIRPKNSLTKNHKSFCFHSFKSWKYKMKVKRLRPCLQDKAVKFAEHWLWHEKNTDSLSIKPFPNRYKQAHKLMFVLLLLLRRKSVYYIAKKCVMLNKGNYKNQLIKLCCKSKINSLLANQFSYMKMCHQQICLNAIRREDGAIIAEVAIQFISSLVTWLKYTQATHFINYYLNVYHLWP